MTPTPAHPVFSICMMNGVFDEVAESLRYGFHQLGYPVEVLNSAFRSGTRAVVLGAQLVTQWDKVPANAIIFNFEQLGAPSQHITDDYIRQLGRHTVWDYSQRNIDWMRAHGLQTGPVPLVRIGHSPGLVRVPTGIEQDIDVLFYGAVNERRYRILEAIKAAGMRMVLATNMFGAERDHAIARSKVLLNMHYYENKIFEVARVGFLLANGKAVVTEAGPDTEIEGSLRPAMAAVPYDQLVEACRALVAEADYRHALEDCARYLFSARSQADFLREAVSAALIGGKSR